MNNSNANQRKLAAIMFTDMVGYSALANIREADALELLYELQSLLRAFFPQFNGREVKTTGDGFLVEFPSALHATQCALEMQKAVAARNITQPKERLFQVRIGIHVGDVEYRDGDVYGDGVNIAARIEPLAKAGGICLSETVYFQVRNKTDVQFMKIDTPVMKNIADPVGVYQVILAGEPEDTPRIGVAATSRARRSIRAWASGLVASTVLGTMIWRMVDQSRNKHNQTTHLAAKPPSTLVASSSSSMILIVNDDALSQKEIEQEKGKSTDMRMRFEDTDIYSIFHVLFTRCHKNYTLDPNLKKVSMTVNVNAQTFLSALDTLARASPRQLICRLENGVYNIRLK